MFDMIRLSPFLNHKNCDAQIFKYVIHYMTLFRCAVFWGCDHTAFTRKLGFAPPLARIACTPLSRTRVVPSLDALECSLCMSSFLAHVLEYCSLSHMRSGTPLSACSLLSHMCSSSLKHSICCVETELHDMRVRSNKRGREKRERHEEKRRVKRERHQRLNSRTEVFRGYADQVITSKRLVFVKIRKLFCFLCWESSSRGLRQ
jgi:hypothetical protein